MQEIIVRKIVRGKASPGGKSVSIELETEIGPTKLTVPLEAARSLPIISLEVITKAEAAAAGRPGFYSFKLVECRLAEDRASEEVLLMIRLHHSRSFLSFQLPDRGLDRLAADVAAIKERRNLPPHHRKDH